MAASNGNGINDSGVDSAMGATYLPAFHAMLVWPDVDKVDSQDEEDDPQGQQDQHAVSD